MTAPQQHNEQIPRRPWQRTKTATPALLDREAQRRYDGIKQSADVFENLTSDRQFLRDILSQD